MCSGLKAGGGWKSSSSCDVDHEARPENGAGSGLRGVGEWHRRSDERHQHLKNALAYPCWQSCVGAGVMGGGVCRSKTLSFGRPVLGAKACRKKT